MAKKSNWKQATAENTSVGATIRNDDGQIGKISRYPKRGALTATAEDGTTFKVEPFKFEVDLNAPVTLTEASEGKAPAKAAPVRERKETVTRVVDGRAYTYANLGGGKIDNGDAVAQALRGKTLDEVYVVAASTIGVEESELRAAYAGNNPGRQRMTLGNLMRSHAKATGAGLAYVPPFRAEAEKAKRKEAREVERKAKAEEAAKAKAEREAKAAARKQEAADKANAKKLAAEEAAKAKAAAAAAKKADKTAQAA